MNLRGFIVGLFRGFSSSNEELEKIRSSAREDAALVVGTYVDEFESEASKLFREASLRLTGPREEETIEVSFERIEEAEKVDYSDFKRSELMTLCKEKEISFSRNATKKDLLELLGVE